MSVAESHDFINDLNETDFPYLSSKPSGKRADKGKRSGAERVAARTLADQATVVKTIHDPQNVLGKRRKARLASTCSDNIALDVPYSLNKNNRWEEVDVISLAKSAENSEIEVAIIEQSFKANDFLDFNATGKAQAVHLVSTDGKIKSVNARGKGADPVSLMHGLKKDDSNSDDSDDDIRLEYRIVRPHANSAVLSSGKSGKSGKQRNKNRRNKKIDMDELEASDMENSYHPQGDHDVYKPSRDFRFCLGDYISTPNSTFAAVEVRRASIESVLPLETEDGADFAPKPIDLLDISSAVRTPGAFENAIINTSRWPGFNFVQQVDSLSKDEKITVRWIDANHQRATVDLTRKLFDEEDITPMLFVVLEKSRKGHFQLLLNAAIPPNGPFCWRTIKDIFRNKKITNIPSAIECLLALVRSWKTCMPQEVKRCQPGSRYFTAGENFEGLVNSKTMASRATVIEHADMVQLLRETSTNVEGNSFERIEDEDLISSDSFSDDPDCTVKNNSVKCHTCKENAPEELFELDEYWQCRQCLRQHVVNLIRTKNIPMEIPFVVQENGSGFDVLPSLIPLPLINFYTKLAALDLLQNSDNDVEDLMTCPSCEKDVRVERPNDFKSCICNHCNILWCPDCNSEPHWPLSCDQFAEWTAKWEQQYAVEYMADELSKFIRRIHCTCGAITECGDMVERKECHSCGISFNPTTLKVESKKHYWPYPPRVRKCQKARLEQEEPLEVKQIALIPVNRVVKKDIAEPCARARKLRFTRMKGSEIEKKCRKMKETDGLFMIFPDLRRCILCLAEHGLAWIYMNKGANPLKSALLQLLKQCDELTDDILDGKTNLLSRVVALDVALDKMVDQLKKVL